MTTFEERILTQLTRIADGLEGVYAVLEAFVSEPEEHDPACQHPPEAREDFGLTAGQIDWFCNPTKGGCGYRSVNDAHG